MESITFGWLGSDLLRTRLSEGIKSASIYLVGFLKRPTSVILWGGDGLGLKIKAEMFDIAERQERGILSFSEVKSSDVESIDLLEVKIPKIFASDLMCAKLIANELNTTLESGVLFESSDNQKIIIVAGMAPYTLAIHGLIEIPHIFEPEYELHDYKRVEF